MAAFVLDAFVALSRCFPGNPTEDTPYSRRILEELATRDAVVPEVWAFEVANGIFVSHTKRMRITGRQIADYLELLKALPIRVETQDLWAKCQFGIAGTPPEPCGLRRRLFVFGAADRSSDRNLRRAAEASGTRASD